MIGRSYLSRGILCLGLAGLLAGCAGGVKVRNPDAHGLRYFLPKAVIEIRGEVPVARPQVLEVSLSKRVVADPCQLYQLRLPRADVAGFLLERRIAVGPQGLLTRQGGGAADGAHARDSLTGGKMYEKRAPAFPVAPFLLDLDPFDAGRRAQAVSTLGALGIRLKVELPPVGSGVPAGVRMLAPGQGYLAEAGILRHPLVEVGLVLDFRPCCPRVDRLSVLVPDRRVLMQLPAEVLVRRAVYAPVTSCK